MSDYNASSRDDLIKVISHLQDENRKLHLELAEAYARIMMMQPHKPSREKIEQIVSDVFKEVQ